MRYDTSSLISKYRIIGGARYPSSEHNCLKQHTEKEHSGLFRDVGVSMSKNTASHSGRLAAVKRQI